MNEKFRVIRILLILIIITSVCYFIASKNGNTLEASSQTDSETERLEELKSNLTEKLKIINEKNSIYTSILNEEQNQWNETLAKFDDEENQVAEIVENYPVVGVGDSVLLGAINSLYNKFPNGYFDGKVSRTLSAGMDVLSNLESEGRLGDILILALANNGDYSNRKNAQLMEQVGDREVYWITAAGADDPAFNDKFRVFAADYPNLHIVEWEEVTFNHPEYLYGDGVHLRDGAATRAYAETVYQAICDNYIDIYRQKKEVILAEHEEELKNKIEFFGNDLLISSFDSIYEKFGNHFYTAKLDYNFDTLYNDIKNKVDNNTLEHRLVFMFDKKANITEDDYQKLIDLCNGHEIYICNFTNNETSLSTDTVHVVNFADVLFNPAKNIDENPEENIEENVGEM